MDTEIDLTPHIAELAKKHDNHWVVLLTENNHLARATLRDDAVLQQALSELSFTHLSWRKDAMEV